MDNRGSRRDTCTESNTVISGINWINLPENKVNARAAQTSALSQTKETHWLNRPDLPETRCQQRQSP